MRFRILRSPQVTRVYEKVMPCNMDASESSMQKRVRIRCKSQLLLNDIGGETQKAALQGLKKCGSQNERECAFDCMMALDHSLQLSGMSLGMFVPPKDLPFEEQPAGRLLDGQRRFWVSAEDDSFPYEVPPHLSGKGRKSVIEEDASGSRRWELTEYEGPRPMLGLTCDEGSKMFSSLWFMAGHLRARMGWTRDPGHRGWRDFQNAVNGAGFRMVLLETLVLLNLPFGPWLSEGFYAQMQEAIVVYSRHGSSQDPLFMQMYPKIAHDKRTDDSGEYGTADHEKQTFADFLGDRAWQQKGTKVKLRSFFKWQEAVSEHLLPSWHSRLLLLLWMGLQLGWFAPGELPGIDIHSARTKAKLLEARVDDEAASGSSGDKKLESLRVRCKNTLHMATALLSDEMRRKRVCIMVHGSEHMRKFHRVEEVMLAMGADEVLIYYARLAAGSYDFVLQKTLRAYESDAMLHDLGIGLVDFINRGRAPPVETSIGVQVALLDEQDILEELFVFIRGLIKYRAMGFLHHSHSIPGQFALLASTDDKHVALGLQHAKVAWEAILAAEARATSSAPERKLLDTVAFHNWLWPRETLLA